MSTLVSLVCTVILILGLGAYLIALGTALLVAMAVAVAGDA